MNQHTTKINNESKEATPQKIYAGIDISKANLDVSLKNRYYRFANDRNGHVCMLSLFKKQEEKVQVVYESTGYLSRRLIPLFKENGIAQSCLNPIRVRNYARSEKQQAKTDKLDARILERMGREKQLEEDFPLRPEIIQLKEYETVLNFYVKRKAQLKNEQESTQCEDLRNQLKESLEQEEEKIRKLQQEIEKIITSNEELKRKYEAYQEVKGIGKRNAGALLSQMPELGHINRRQAAALLGVAPYAKESGTKNGKREIKGGRKNMRQLLYLGTASAIRSNEVLKKKYKELKERGKSSKCALIACCRILLTHLNSIAKKTRERSGAASDAAEGGWGEKPQQSSLEIREL